MASVETLSVQDISARARPYPAHLLPEGGSALGLFCAAFLGHNDVIHFHRKNMVATCVDVDRIKLGVMATLYPVDWRFVEMDAWLYAACAKALDEKWDVVSVDTFTGDAEERSIESLDLWCALAGELVTVTITSRIEAPVIPDDWSADLFPRGKNSWGDDVFWLVLRRD